MIRTVRRTWSRYGIPRHALPWLIYLTVLALPPVFDPDATARAWIAVAGIVIVFLPVYAWTTRQLERRPYLWRRGPGAIAGVLALVVLGVVGSAVNAGSTVFLVYAASLAGRLRPRRSALTWVLVAAGAVIAAGLLSPIPIAYRLVAFGPVAVLTPILGMASVFEAERSRSDARLRMAQDEIERLAAVAERERIARDLHDLLGHTLSTITLKAQLAGRLLGNDAVRATREIEDVERISREALAEVRSAVRGYHAHGMQGELANARLALQAAGIAFDYYWSDVELRPQAETVLALALREGVTNVVRHAGAEQVRVALERDRDWLILSVDDDGTGVSSERAPGSGIEAMRERVRALGGRVDLGRSRIATRAGTRLEVALPIDRAVPPAATP